MIWKGRFSHTNFLPKNIFGNVAFFDDTMIIILTFCIMFLKIFFMSMRWKLMWRAIRVVGYFYLNKLSEYIGRKIKSLPNIRDTIFFL